MVFSLRHKVAQAAWFALSGIFLSGVTAITQQPTPAAPPAAEAAPMAANADSTSALMRSEAVEALVAATGTSFTTEVNALLSDPMVHRPDIKYIDERRKALAKQPGSIENFRKVANEFAARGAYYSAVELLWFAEKMTRDAGERGKLNDEMRAIIDKLAPINQEIEATEATWKSGRPLEALEQLKLLIDKYPYAELAYFKTGYLYYYSYLAEEAKGQELLQPSVRAKLFRLCYEMFITTIVIDPLYNDAYYYLNRSRDLLPDQPEFLQKSEVLSSIALNFMKKVQPAVERLDSGDRSLSGLIKAAEAFESVQHYAYAVYMYRVALVQPEIKAEEASVITGQINRLLAEKLD